jgi:CRISPR-associated protein (TIGR03986 family)
MIEGVIKINESKKKVLFGVIYYGDKKEQPVPPHFILSKELDDKKCLFRRDKGRIVEIEVDGEKLQEKGLTKKQSYQSQKIQQSKERRDDRDVIDNEYGEGQKEPISDKGPEFFLNPYNFVDVSGPTPRYSFECHPKFHPHLNSGYIDVELKTVTPIFIPNPENSKCIEIKGDHGKTFKHKEMKFFKINGKPAIPSTSLKGMLRSTIETLSNSCFPHDYTKNERLNYIFHRLDVENDSKKIRFLKPGILKEYNQKWYFVELDMVKVLTVVDRFKGENIDGKTYEKIIYFARNQKGEIEKISIKASTGGIDEYINRKRKNRRFENPDKVNSLKTSKFQVKEVNDKEINGEINKFNKTFPYIDLRKNYGLTPAFYGIVRKKREKWGGLYKLKEVALRKEDLKNLLCDYNDKQKNKDNHYVEYRICQMYLKTSYDIETKTQDRLFFKFGEEDLYAYVKNELTHGRPFELEENHIKQFRNVLAQRYENLNQREEKDYLMKWQPTSKSVKDGMLAYFYPGADSYLSYTQVARKPYKYGLAEILEKMGKSRCSNEEALCPACNIFGGVNIKKKGHKDDKDSPPPEISIGGKISVGFGEIEGEFSFEEVTLKPLGEPKPSFYQFYVVDNRKNDSNPGKSLSFDFQDIKLGRKLYLKHDIEKLDYRDDEKTNLNSTVQLLKPGAGFIFRINYFNLSHYELGLLLNSLDIQCNGKQLDHQLGMGKPLGLGRIKINPVNITKIDRKKRYSSLIDGHNGESLMSDTEKEKYINIFQRFQVDVNKGIPFEKIKIDDKQQKDIQIDEYKVKSVPDFNTLSYIKEFTRIKSINNGISLPYPIRYPMKLDKNEKDEKKKKKGFKWFMEEKNYVDQRLFSPIMLGKVSDEKIKKEIPLFNWGQESEK